MPWFNLLSTVGVLIPAVLVYSIISGEEKAAAAAAAAASVENDEEPSHEL